MAVTVRCGGNGVAVKMFRLIFVLDLLDGVVVHAKRGEREKYEPIHRFSSVVETSDPLRVLEAVRPAEIYLADLNRLTGTGGSNKEAVSEIRAKNNEARLMLDCGVRGVVELREVAEAGLADTIVLGTETASLSLLEAASNVFCSCSTSASASVSLDLFNKKVLARDESLRVEPLGLLEKLNAFSVEEIIVLELDRVGTKRGIDFDFLARCVECSEHSILCGGGVRGCEDLSRLEAVGVKGALVATAVHDRAIPLDLLRTPAPPQTALSGIPRPEKRAASQPAVPKAFPTEPSKPP